MIDFITSFEFTSFLALLVYWTPLAICLAVYLLRTVHLYHNDLEKCQQKYYAPELTVGLIIWMIFLSVTPLVNVFALVFDCAGSVFRLIIDAFEIPLVRHQPKDEPETKSGAK